ncbi:MAG: YybH family protein [Acidimicrobiia bacterium]
MRFVKESSKRSASQVLKPVGPSGTLSHREVTNPSTHPRTPPSAVLAVVFMALLASCFGDDASPATTPATVATTPVTSAPTTTSTATEATPTTVDRLTEVEAIVRDLEERRLLAMNDKDVDAFRALFANDAYLAESLPVLGIIEFLKPPGDVELEILQLLVDRDDCIAARVHFAAIPALGPDSETEILLVLQRTGNGAWGFAYGGTGWLCDGTHPLEEP